MTEWSKPLRSLHDSWSSDFLNILPSPLLAVAGECTKNHYRKILSDKTRRLSVRISSEAIIGFDLHFSADSFPCITAYVSHPSGIYFSQICTQDRAVSGCCTQLLLMACRLKEQRGHLCEAKSWVSERRSRSSSTGIILGACRKRENPS